MPLKDSMFPEGSIVSAGSYCRDPLGLRRPFCYKDNKLTECNIPVCTGTHFAYTFQGFFVFSGAERWKIGILVLFFPSSKKNPNLKKDFFFSQHTHTLHNDILLPLHLISPSIE